MHAFQYSTHEKYDTINITDDVKKVVEKEGIKEGIFFYGAGDTGKFGHEQGMYLDTMDDTIVNIIGAIMGSLLYVSVQRKKFALEKIAS